MTDIPVRNAISTIIRPALISDLFRICEVHNTAWGETEWISFLQYFTGDHPCELLVYVDRQQDPEAILGYICYSVASDLDGDDAEMAELLDVVVLPEFGGRNIGTQLVRAMHDDLLRRTAATQVILHHAISSKLLYFYSRLGYEPADKALHYYDPGEHAYLRIYRLPRSA